MDRLSRQHRSWLMSRVRGSDTTPEILLRKALWAEGLRYRLRNKLSGHPDIVFIRQKVAIFVDGCFWHSCPLHGTKPKTNVSFWKEKLLMNRARDKRVNTTLRAEGWTVLRFWQHDVQKSLSKCVNRTKYHLSKSTNHVG